jgi:hypothetical protein
MDRLVYLQLVERPHDTDAQAIANYVIRYMKDQFEIAQQEQRQTLPAMDIGEIAAKVQKILDTQVPVWRQLKMI